VLGELLHGDAESRRGEGWNSKGSKGEKKKSDRDRQGVGVGVVLVEGQSVFLMPDA
jgi:hypothetical protein